MANGSDGRRELGRRGEEIAASHLLRLGYRIHETNFRCRYGELDIVASEGDVLVFVEVRTRSGPGAGGPEESITPRKQRKLRQVAEAYLQLRYQVRDVDYNRGGKKRVMDDVRPPPVRVGRDGELPACRIDAVVIALGPTREIERVEVIRGAVVD